MKGTTIIYIVILAILFSIFSNCKKPKCGDFLPGPSDTSFSFRLVDENTKETLIAAWGTKYDYEDIKFEHESGDSIRLLYIEGDGRITFRLLDHIYTRNVDDFLGKTFENTYYLYLPEKDMSYDVDTIHFKFDINTVTDMPCIPFWYQNFMLTYNDSLYVDGDFVEWIDFVKHN